MAVDLGDELIENNRRWVETTFPGPRPVEPAHGIAVVACMDSRIDVFQVVGLPYGSAHVLRNAGGVITDDVIRSLSISQRLLGTRRIVLIHHTDCGMQKITDDEYREVLEADTGLKPHFAIESFSDPVANVRQSIERLRRSPFLLSTDEIVGFVYDVDTGLLERV